MESYRFGGSADGTWRGSSAALSAVIRSWFESYLDQMGILSDDSMMSNLAGYKLLESKMQDVN